MGVYMKKIAAGIVLYNPDLERLDKNITSIISQVESLVLVDNNSININEVVNKYKSIDKITIIQNNKNMGVATALNQIIKLCENKNYDWVLTLDQDSISPSNLIKEYCKYISLERLAIITPNIIDINSKNISQIENNKLEYEYVNECITSASLIKVDICNELGYFDDKMFIDYVDFDYCTRVNLNNYKIIKVNTTNLQHEVGNLKEKFILGKKINVYNHTAFRKYYYSRNIIYYCKKYKGLIDIKKSYIKLIKRFLVVIFYENEKFDKMKSMICGIKDGRKM